MTERFFDFVLKERTRNFVAFIWYCYFVIYFFGINLPIILDIIITSIFIISSIFVCIYIINYIDEMFNRNMGIIRKKLLEEVNKISKELLMFIPIYLISNFIVSLIIVGEPANQSAFIKELKEFPIIVSISSIIIAPITEEIIFRFLPYKFIKNEILYIIISALIFAAAHVVKDPNPFYYILCYIIRSFYYGYRYYKTKDLWVTMSMHCFNNIIATMSILF